MKIREVVYYLNKSKTIITPYHLLTNLSSNLEVHGTSLNIPKAKHETSTNKSKTIIAPYHLLTNLSSNLEVHGTSLNIPTLMLLLHYITQQISIAWYRCFTQNSILIRILIYSKHQNQKPIIYNMISKTIVPRILCREVS